MKAVASETIRLAVAVTYADLVREALEKISRRHLGSVDRHALKDLAAPRGRGRGPNPPSAPRRRSCGNRAKARGTSGPSWESAPRQSSES
jgi:hypothetical protein